MQKSSPIKTANIWLAIILVVSVFFNAFLAIFLIPIMIFVGKGKRPAMIIAGLYSGFLILVDAANYIEFGRNESGDFNSSLLPVYAMLIVYVIAISSLIKAFKVNQKGTLPPV